MALIDSVVLKQHYSQIQFKKSYFTEKKYKKIQKVYS